MKTLQSGIQRQTIIRGKGYKSNGLLLRGVVVATYVVDDADHPENASNPDAEDWRPRGVYCDVLVYSSVPGMRDIALKAVVVSQDRGSLHDGRLWIPKAATKDITNTDMSADAGTEVANFDGDHVLIGFLDDNINQPIILRGIPHPNTDTDKLDGAEDKGRTRQLRLVDGNADFFKHHGSYYGLDQEGNFLLDTTFANDGELDDEGAEADPPTDGKGSQTHKLPQDATHTIALFDMSDPANPVEITTVVIEKDNHKIDVQGNVVLVKTNKIELGADGSADKAVLDSKLQIELNRIWAEINTLTTVFNAHLHADQYLIPLIPIAQGPVIPTPPVTPAPFPAAPSPTNSGLVTIDS